MASSKTTVGEKEINLLLLGVTGVGKSTFINGLVNHLHYDKLDDALGKDLLYVIPTSFVMFNFEGEEQTISNGTDENEVFAIGQSSTQTPRKYEFRFGGDRILRIIDTPGIGDTRGIDQDKINVQNILTYISQYDHLNGICLLLKPNEARLDPRFVFCIKELLTNLHRSAAENIVFCFTHARATFFRGGSTRGLLEEVLADLKRVRGIEVPLKQENTFYFDNESYRFVVANHRGIRFDDEQKQVYTKSWDKSVAQSMKLMSYVAQRSPHRVKETLSLNKARRLIDELNRPIAEIARNIQYNHELISKQINKLNRTEHSIADLQNQLKIMTIDLELISLGYPRTVCTASGCIGHIKFNNQIKIEYKTHCHEHCYLENVPSEVVAHSALQKCAAMNSEGICKKCGCSWTSHQHISYETKQAEKEFIDPSVGKQIITKEERTKVIRETKELLETRNREYEEEQSTLTRTCVKLFRFLHANSIIPYNDGLFKYVEYLICEEQEKHKLGADNQYVIDGLKNLVKTYQARIDAYKIMSNPSDTHGELGTLHLEDIEREIESLYQLPHSGRLLRIQIEIIRQSTIAAQQNGTEYSQLRNSIFLKNLRVT